MSARQDHHDLDCRELLRGLEEACSDGALESLLSEAPRAEMSELVHHLERCDACRREAESLRRVEREVTRTFHVLKETESPPDDATFETMLRRVEEPAASWTHRKVRRALRPVLWITFLLLTLLAFAVLAGVASRYVLNGG